MCAAVADVYSGVWELFAAGGIDYASFFQPFAQVASVVVGPAQDVVTVTYLDGSSIAYTGSGLAYSSLTITGTITGLEVRDTNGLLAARMSSTAEHPFAIRSGAAIFGGTTFFNQLLSGDNLIVGSGKGTAGAREVLKGGLGADTYRPGNGFTLIDDLIGASTLDLSGLAGPSTVDLESQRFTVGGVTGSMSGVADVIGTDGDDTVFGVIDITYTVKTGKGNDLILAYDYNLTKFQGGHFIVDAGEGDDVVIANTFGYGDLQGGAGNDTLNGGGDLRFYRFNGFETLANTNFLTVLTEQLRNFDRLTNLNQFNGGNIGVNLFGGGTVDFDRLLDPGLSVTVTAFSPGTNVVGSDLADAFQDLSNGIVDGFPAASTFYGGGGDDILYNDSGVGIAVFSGKMADYTVDSSGLAGSWRVIDNRPGSPDGIDLMRYISPDAPVLRFADYTASVNEQIAYKADPSKLPASIYNGVLELFGPDGFDYPGLFPALNKAKSEVLSVAGDRYTITYANGVQLVFTGTGLTLSGTYAPSGGVVTGLEAYDSTVPGSPLLLAKFSSNEATGHLMRVPFSNLLLAGGSRVYQLLMSGNNYIVGGPNDDVIVDNLGFNTFADIPDRSFNTLALGRNVDSYRITRNSFGEISRVDFVDAPAYFQVDWSLDPDPPSGGDIAGEVLGYVAEYAGQPYDPNRPITNPLILAILALVGGDPHLVSLDGLGYSLQSVGEYVLTKSTLPGDPFEIQVRFVPYIPGATVVQQTATQVGTDRLTFDAIRPDVVRINGLTADFSGGPLQLDGGVLFQDAPGQWRVAYAGGETLTVDRLFLPYLTISFSPGSVRTGDSLQGLWGDFDGDRTNDFQLADGTVLQRPLGQNTLYGVFANAWRVTDATSLLDYGAGESTGTYTSTVIPRTFSISDLPADVIDRALEVVNAARITDPILRDFAIYDYIVTGDIAAVDVIAKAEDAGAGAYEKDVPIVQQSAPLIGVIAKVPKVIEAAAGPTAVSFEAFRTGPAVGSVVVNWAVVSPGAGYFDPADFAGGALPSGQVTILQGESVAAFTVNLPAGVLTTASELLRVQISSPAGLGIAASSAQVEVLNDGPASAAPADALFLKLAGPGTLSHLGNDWTLDLGDISQNALIDPIRLALTNAAPARGNDLSGLFGVEGALASFSGIDPLVRLSGGGVRSGITASIDTSSTGALSSVLRLQAKQSNGTGFTGALGDETLTIRATVKSLVTVVDNGDAAFAITGAPAVGSTLSAVKSADDPDGNGAFTYQWQSSANGTSWTPIGTNASTVALTGAEEGRQVRVLVSYTDGEGFAESVQAPAVAVPFVDNGDAAFSITGTPAVGSTLSAVKSADDPDGNGTFTYQWQSSANGTSWTPIGTNAGTVALTGAEEGRQVRVLVSYTDGEGFGESVQAPPVAVPFVDNGDAAFAITGTPAEGSTLSAVKSADDPDGNGTFSYQWESSANGTSWTPIGTDSTYALTSAEAGRQVRVKVSYLDGQGFNESVSASPVTVPAAPTYAVTTGPSTLVEGDTLTATLATTNVAPGTRFYWSLTGPGITSGDIQGGQLTGDGTTSGDGRLSISRGIARDALIEIDETLELRFYADSARSQQVGPTQAFTLKEPLVGNPTNGSDTIIGTAAADILRGVPIGSPSGQRGRASIDRLTGLGAGDLFVLGDAAGVFYDDGNARSQGRGDFGVITDFGAGDRIQLHGSAPNYLLGSGSYQGKSGVFIYARNPERPLSSRVSFYDETIGFVQGSRLGQLNLANSSQFLYTALSTT